MPDLQGFPTNAVALGADKFTHEFAVVSAVYNVSRYLEDFFKSLESQTIGFERIQVILVDDVSTDDSYSKCTAFADLYPGNVSVMQTQQNGGQAVARNKALEFVDAPWVTFTDPDDVLDAHYFEGIRRAILESPETVRLVSAHTIPWDEETGERTDTHPSGQRFAEGLRWVDLDVKPNFIHGQAPVNVFQTRVIRDNGLQFDGRLRYRFEDGKFVSQYLLTGPQAHVALAPDSYYYYRSRAAGDSSVQRARFQKETYLSVCEHGYLPLLVGATARLGEPPSWLQTLVLYDLAWLFRSESHDRSITVELGEDAVESFNDGVEKVMSYITPSVVSEFSMIKLPDWLKFQFARGFSPDAAHGSLHVRSVDRERELTLVEYYFTGEAPDENIALQGKRILPTFETTREFVSFGRTRVRLRIVWLPHQSVIRFAVNGEAQAILVGAPREAPAGAMQRENYANYTWARVNTLPKAFRVEKGSLKQKVQTALVSAPRKLVRSMKDALTAPAIEDRLIAFLLRTPWYRRAFLHSWIIMDKDFEANDSGEELYRWIRENRPDLPIWFVLRSDSKDWNRLKKDGFKLLAYGERRWKVAHLLAAHMISSHADRYITNPLPFERYGDPQWKFTFLQHGVIKGDLSSWLNGKKIDAFVTSTEPEKAYISGAGPYKFSDREVVLSGLPRHDALLRKSLSVAPDAVNQLLIAPTWRQHLVGSSTGSSTVRERNLAFESSEFAQQWRAFLHAPRLKELADRHGLRLVFLPHPNLTPYRDVFELPDYIETREFGVDDIQDVVSRSAAMVTDFSSAAFNLAYLYRPTVYFQFDRGEYFQNHTEGEGYFSYEDHGFGPVAETLDSAIDGLGMVLQKDSAAHQMFRARAEKTFPLRDGRNSERVFAAVSALHDPVPPRFLHESP